MRGWFVDLAAQGWTGVDDIEIFLGTMEAGRPLAHAAIQQSRPDVATALKNAFCENAGWTANVSITSLPVGANTLSVYAHTPGKGWWLRQVPITRIDFKIQGNRFGDVLLRRLGNSGRLRREMRAEGKVAGTAH